MIRKNLAHTLKLLWANARVAAKWDVLIEKAVTLKYVDTLSFGQTCTLQSGAYVYGSRRGRRVAFGDGVVVAAGCMVLGEGGATVGAHTHLGPHVVVTTQYGDSTGEMITGTPRLKVAPVVIGRGSWIGTGAVIMPGTVLGERCVVAPGSVVYGVWGDGVTLSGNPARRDRTSFRRSSPTGKMMSASERPTSP